MKHEKSKNDAMRHELDHIDAKNLESPSGKCQDAAERNRGTRIFILPGSFRQN